MKVSLLLIGLVLWLDNMGFNVTTILASLGVIGLAVGLASKNFIEDLIGAMTLHATGVVKRDESIRFGGQFGVRRGHRPAHDDDSHARAVTDHHAERCVCRHADRESRAAGQVPVYQPQLGLRYETTPDQLRYVLIELRKLLYAHPKVETRIRASASPASGSLAASGHLLLLSEANYAEYLAVAEDLDLRIMDTVAQAGAGFAFPSVTEYRACEQANDEALARQAEAEVRRWREQGNFTSTSSPTK